MAPRKGPRLAAVAATRGALEGGLSEAVSRCEHLMSVQAERGFDFKLDMETAPDRLRVSTGSLLSRPRLTLLAGVQMLYARIRGCGRAIDSLSCQCRVPGAYSPGARASIASACRPPSNSARKRQLIARCRSTLLLPRNASETILIRKWVPFEVVPAPVRVPVSV
jgi:hypothetical protein